VSGVVLTAAASGIDGPGARPRHCWFSCSCRTWSRAPRPACSAWRSMAARLGPLGIRVNRSSTPYLPNTPAVVRRWHQKNVSAAGCVRTEGQWLIVTVIGAWLWAAGLPQSWGYSALEHRGSREFTFHRTHWLGGADHCLL